MIDRETAFKKARKRVNLFAVVGHIIIPAAYIVLIYYLNKGFYKEGSSGGDAGAVLLYAIITVSFLDLIAAMFLFRVMPKGFLHYLVGAGQKKATGKTTETKFALVVQSYVVIIFAFNNAITIYGIIMYLLGYGKYVWVPFFAASIIAYFINRPDRAFMEKLWNKLETMGILDSGSDNATPPPIE